MSNDKSILKRRKIQDRAILKTAKHVLKIESDAVAALSKRLGADFPKIVHALRDGKERLIVTGMGKSGLIGQKIAASMSSVGLTAIYMHAAEAIHGDLGLISKNDIIINCIGKIKPFINENNLNQIEAAIKVNSMFPLLLSKMIKIKNVKIYQIATDCVFSGSDGNYNEMSKHDALDVYGKSKSLGEVNIKNFFNIRASIIGKELDTKNSLVEWFLSNEKKEKIFGFKDHLWNGVTTSVFSQILYTIINEKINIPNNFHLVPKDKVSKYKLMQFLKNYYGFKDLKIIRKNSNNKINRVLETSHKLVNNEIWLKTKYKKKLSIKEIISTL